MLRILKWTISDLLLCSCLSLYFLLPFFINLWSFSFTFSLFSIYLFFISLSSSCLPYIYVLSVIPFFPFEPLIIRLYFPFFSIHLLSLFLLSIFYPFYILFSLPLFVFLSSPSLSRLFPSFISHFRILLFVLIHLHQILF